MEARRVCEKKDPHPAVARSLNLANTARRASARPLPPEGATPRRCRSSTGSARNKQNFLSTGRMPVEAGHPVLLLDLRTHGDSDVGLTPLGDRDAVDVRAAHGCRSCKSPVCCLTP